MQITKAGRAGGKTTAALRWMRENPGAIMCCMNEREADRLRRENKDIEPERFVSARSALVREGFDRYPKMAFDNLDMILEDLFRCDPGMATFNGSG